MLNQMAQNNFSEYLPYLIPFVFVDIVLRAFALWHAARADRKVWFVVLLIANTMGVLPLIYLVFFKNSLPFGSQTKSRTKK